jgi:hypothetical protein
MAIVRWRGTVQAAPEKPPEPNGRLSRIEWFALLGLGISLTSLFINLYRLRNSK